MNFFKSPFQRRNPTRRRGVATVEVALCLIFVLLPVTLGGFQFAMVFMTQHALQQVARESARYGAVHFNEDTFDDSDTQGNVPNSTRSLRNVIRRQAAANGIAYSEINGSLLPGNLRGGITVAPNTVAGRLSGQPLTVTISYPMKRRALLGSLFFKSPDGKIEPLRLGFLDSNFTATSTILME